MHYLLAQKQRAREKGRKKVIRITRENSTTRDTGLSSPGNPELALVSTLLSFPAFSTSKVLKLSLSLTHIIYNTNTTNA